MIESFRYITDSYEYKLFGSILLILLLFRYIFQQLPNLIRKSYRPDQFVKDLLRNPFKRSRGFENFIPLTSNIVFDSLSYHHPTLSFQYRIPACLVNTDRYLDLGGLLALTDLVTSIIILVNDKSHRGGVSVTLAGQTHAQHYPSHEIYRNQLKVGDIVVIKAHLKKTGNNIAFADMLVTSLNGDRLASCSHMKFLPSGFM
jgi:hypothetical protein